MHSRRAFFRAVGLLLAVPLTVALGSVAGRARAGQARPRRVTLPADLRDDVTFVDDVIVCRDEDQLRVFSARCTHLGCSIARQEDGLLVCPCHGSRFRPDGSVARGPATRPLAALPFHVDAASATIVVDVT